MNQVSDRRSLAGVLLVVIGLVLLGAQWFDITGAGVLGAVSGIFLVAYVVKRQYWFLIPGMILGGLAVGVGFEEAGYDPQGDLVVLALAAGFVGIYLVDMFVTNPSRWWPLVPGGILAVVGANEIAEGTAAAAAIARLWPLGLVAVGIVMLVATQVRRTEDRSAT